MQYYTTYIGLYCIISDHYVTFFHAYYVVMDMYYELYIACNLSKLCVGIYSNTISASNDAKNIFPVNTEHTGIMNKKEV